VIRLRSIGDTVLCTPALRAIRDQLPQSEIHVLLEDWVAPLLEGLPHIDSVISVGRSLRGRLATVKQLRKARYDAVINLHGGTTSTFLTRASGARIRIGYGHYQYSSLYSHIFPTASQFWGAEKTHSVEQQLALLGYSGIAVRDRPQLELPHDPAADASIKKRLNALGITDQPIALLHPCASSFTKQWAASGFAAVADHLADRGISAVAVGTPGERDTLDRFRLAARAPTVEFEDLDLREITSLARMAGVFLGNDSGIAHIAAAVGTPPAVLFGSSNRAHWTPWTKAPSRVIFKEFECQPCPGYECKVFGEPRCIEEISVEDVIKAVDELIESAVFSP